MRVAVLQYPVAWGDVRKNVGDTVTRIAALVGKTDVALLPEMFSTGFCVDHPELATADDTGIAIAGTFICRDGDKLYNRGFLLSPHAAPQFTDKRHLYATGGEDRFFTPGKKRTIFTYQGVKILLLICYDVRFPVWARNVWGDDYDLILVSANWPEARVVMWDILVASRAVENQCYIVAANLVGDDGAGWHYNGHSVAYDTRMNELLKFADNEEGTRIAELSMPVLKHYREALPLWRDTDRKLVRLEFSE